MLREGVARWMTMKLTCRFSIGLRSRCDFPSLCILMTDSPKCFAIISTRLSWHQRIHTFGTLYSGGVPWYFSNLKYVPWLSKLQACHLTLHDCSPKKTNQPSTRHPFGPTKAAQHSTVRCSQMALEQLLSYYHAISLIHPHQNKRLGFQSQIIE